MWIVDATHMSVVAFVRFCLRLYDFVTGILDSKIDQGSYILGLLDRYLALPKFQNWCMGRI